MSSIDVNQSINIASYRKIFNFQTLSY